MKSPEIIRRRPAMRVTRVVREENEMSDWLSNLMWECESMAHTDEGRVAHVARELVKAVWVANKHLIKKKDISLECYLSENLSLDGWALLNELDAKELLEQ